VNRLLKSRRADEAANPLDDVTTSDDAGSSRGGFRTALLGLGVAGLAYLAARRVRRSGSAPSMGEVKETVGDVRSGDGFEIPIGDTGEDGGDQSGSSVGAGTTEGAIGNEPMPGEDLSSGRPAGGDASESEGDDRDSDDRGVPDSDDPDRDVTEGGDAERDDAEADESADELSEEAIEERTEEDAHEEPAEPGEMTVDEEVADDVLGEENEESGDAGSETEEAADRESEETDAEADATGDSEDDADDEESE